MPGDTPTPAPVPAPSPALVEALDDHTTAAHLESPGRFGTLLASVQAMPVLEQGAVFVETILAEHVGASVDGFIAAHREEFAHWIAPKLADFGVAILKQFGSQAEQHVGGS